MDRTKVQDIRKTLEKIKGQIESEHNVKVEIGSVRFSDYHGVFKLEICDVREGEEGLTLAAKEFKKLASRYGFEPSALGACFGFRGDTYEITGLSTRSYKFPILAKNLSNGRTYKFDPYTIKKNIVEDL